MSLRTVAAPATWSLCVLSLFTHLALADTREEEQPEQPKLDLRLLTFHPTPLPQASSDVPTQLYLRLERRDESQQQMESHGHDAEDFVAVDVPTDEERLLAYRERIADLQARDGLYAPGLVEAHEALGKLHQQLGEHEAALAAFQAAQQVMRASAGLYSPGQIPLLRAMIETNLRLGRVPDAHELQQALLNLQQRVHGKDELDFVPALLEWADWNVNLYLSQDSRALTLEVAPGMLNYRNPLLQEAYSRYVKALQILQDKEMHANDARLVEIERKLAALNFMAGRETERSLRNLPITPIPATPSDLERILQRSSTLHFLSGRSALERAVAYGFVVERPDYDAIAERMMALGDWYLLYGRRAEALKTYEDAMKLLTHAQVPEQEAESIIAAGMPVRLPDEVYFESERPRSYIGHIDVAFDLNKYGTASNAEILASTAADPRIERELLRTIRAGKFRPKFKNGRVVDEDRVQLRYYYAVAGL